MFREAVPLNIKLYITLRFLANSDPFSFLMYLFRISKQFIWTILLVVLKDIVKISGKQMNIMIINQKRLNTIFTKLYFFIPLKIFQ
jgi:hypothetical protein